MRTKLFLSVLISTMLASVAFGQFTPGPRRGAPATTPSTGYVLNHVLAPPGTNIASPIPFRLSGTAPLLLYLDWAGTNAAMISNMYFMTQVSVDGSKWMGPGAAGTPVQIKKIAMPGGAGKVIVTNLLEDTEVSGWNWIRLHSISNDCIPDGTLSNVLYITNWYFIQGSL